MVQLATEEIMRYLPHRHPFLLLDRVEELGPGRAGVGVKNVSISDPVFAGHFPVEPIYPGVLMIETAAQLSGIVLAASAEEPAFGYLASVKRFKFLEVVRPGDALRVRTQRRTSFASLHEFSVELSRESQVVASGSLAIALEKR